MTSCVFPGSFDPVTKGHLDLIKRAASVFDQVTVTVMNNIRKSGAIPADKRIELIKKACSELKNVKVEKWEGLLSEYMQIKNEKTVIRGIRSAMELDQEIQACDANRRLNKEYDTFFLLCNPSMSGISSSAVREIAAFGGDICSFVPDELTKEIMELLSKNK